LPPRSCPMHTSYTRCSEKMQRPKPNINLRAFAIGKAVNGLSTNCQKNLHLLLLLLLLDQTGISPYGGVLKGTAVAAHVLLLLPVFMLPRLLQITAECTFESIALLLLFVRCCFRCSCCFHCRSRVEKHAQSNLHIRCCLRYRCCHSSCCFPPFPSTATCTYV